MTSTKSALIAPGRGRQGGSGWGRWRAGFGPVPEPRGGSVIRERQVAGDGEAVACRPLLSALVSCVAWIGGIESLLHAGRDDPEANPKKTKHACHLGKGELPIHPQYRFRCRAIRTTGGEELWISPRTGSSPSELRRRRRVPVCRHRRGKRIGEPVNGYGWMKIRAG